jgi:hypothetical protein
MKEVFIQENTIIHKNTQIKKYDNLHCKYTLEKPYNLNELQHNVCLLHTNMVAWTFSTIQRKSDLRASLIRNTDHMPPSIKWYKQDTHYNVIADKFYMQPISDIIPATNSNRLHIHEIFVMFCEW